MGEASQHSPLGGSACHRFMACPGSVELIKTLPPQPSSRFADEGTEAHAKGEFALGLYRSCGKLPDIDDDAVKLYVDEVIGRWEKGNDLYIEKRVSIDWIDDSMFGTCDAVIVRPGDELVIIDYKHGEGVLVEVENNKQLLYYALGAANEFNFNFKTVTLVIVQPRAPHKDGPVRSWSIPMAELREFERALKEAVAAVKEENAPLVYGGHCTFCPAAGICPEMRQKTYEIVCADFSQNKNVELPNPHSLSKEQLDKVLAASSLIGQWVREVEAYAYNQAMKGQKIEGHKLVKKISHRKWKDVSQVEKLFNGKNVYHKPALKSPAQLEKEGFDKELINALTEKPDTGLTLVKEADRRKEVIVDDIINDFKLLN